MSAKSQSGGSAASLVKRIASIDLLRGLVMVIMALDHVRFYFHEYSYMSPTNVDKTTPILFFTRWITHLCAPTFVFLAGVSAFLTQQRKDDVSLSAYLIKRGIWFILLDFLVIRYGAGLTNEYELISLQVLWALGWGLILLALVTKLNPNWVGLLGLGIVVSHNLLDGVRASSWSSEWQEIVFTALFSKGEFDIAPGYSLFLAFPIIPWFGILAMGYGFGSKLASTVERRTKTALSLGIGMLLIFAALRATNSYGEPSAWIIYPNEESKTILSFFNCTKNAPSLQFTLMILGVSFCIWSLLEKLAERGGGLFAAGSRTSVAVKRSLSWINTFGRVPLFFYILHFYVIHYLALALAYLTWGSNFCSPRPYGHGCNPGLSLVGAYLAWIAIVICLYPLCRYFADLKHREPAWWHPYL